MTRRWMLTLAACASLGLTLGAQSPSAGDWPTFHGDMTARHYAAYTQINTANAHALTLAWAYRASGGTQGAILGGEAPPAAPGRGRGGFGGFGGGAPAVTIKSTPLMVNGVLYLTSPNNVFAVDARTGQPIWHYAWQGRSAIGNRGVGLYHNWLYFETGDNHIVSLDAATGKQRWSEPIAPDNAANFSTSAPIIIGDHVIFGVGGDSGRNATWEEAIDPDTGALQWKWTVTPQPGEPGFDTWPNAAASAIGAGGPWQPPSYDPELNLIYVPTGNPTPSFNGLGREGADLFTCSIVAMNPDTGKVAWYYQTSPHDTHDWDATETPMLVDAAINGRPRKLLILAARNGYYFVLDRTNGHALVVTKLISTADGYTGVDANNVLIPDPKHQPSVGGTIASPDSDGATGYPASSYDPQTGLVYANVTTSYSLFYLNPDPTNPTGYGRGVEYHLGLFDTSLEALHYDTGKPAWVHKFPEEDGFGGETYPGVLTTAGGLLFSGDPSGNFEARDARTGQVLWHTVLGGMTNTPETYLLDGRQYVLIASGDTLYAFSLQ